jgi:peptide/nickel transport system substrate-binding protein
MKKVMLLAMISMFLMLGSLLLNPAYAVPVIKRRDTVAHTDSFVQATIEGGGPETVDPAWCYDTASGELIDNVYDKLLAFDGEVLDKFVPELALCYDIENITGTTSPEGLPLYYRYTFRIRGTSGNFTLEAAGSNPYPGTGSPLGCTFNIASCALWPDVVGKIATVESWTDNDDDLLSPCDYIIIKIWIGCDWWLIIEVHVEEKTPGGSFICLEQAPKFHSIGYTLTPADVEYTFERAMVQDRIGGPTWMFYEPLLNTWGAEGLGDIGNCTHPGPDVALVGNMIDHAVESNATHVMFNIGFPGIYAPFLQILTQSWSGILSKAWVNDYVIGDLTLPDWPGEWGDHSGWICYHYPAVSPLDTPIPPIMCGTGAFKYVILNTDEMYWSVTKFDAYWRGWPSNWPASPYPTDPNKNIKPAGYVTDAKVTWAFTWPLRSAMFLAGDCDIVAVPRENIGSIIGQDGVRCTYPLPSLSVGNMFFTFDLDPTSAYENVYESGFHEDGMPRDFFGNALWGIHTRLGFTYAFDFDTYLATTFLGEAIAPATAIIPGLLCYNPSIPAYKFNLTASEEEFKKVPGLWDTGFTLNILYNSGNIARKNAALMVAANVALLGNTKFHVNAVPLDWPTILGAIVAHQIAMFSIGWMADYPDPHNFAFPFYHSQGTFAAAQNYDNPTMDALIETGIRAAPALRCAIYDSIQSLARQETPSFPIYDAIGRHFERDWVCGWYYNTIYSGTLFYNLWRWYYQPQAAASYAPYVVSNRYPSDVNYDGKVDMKDVGWVCKAYGSYYGPPPHARWNFRCDVSNDRKVDMKDVGFVCQKYGAVSLVWTPP